MTPKLQASLLFLAAASIISGCGGGDSTDGPLSAGDLSLGQPVEVGQDFSLGTVLLFVDSGEKPAEIERVRLLGVNGSLEMLGIHTRLLPSNEGTFTGIGGFPPSKYESKPLAQQNQVPVARTRTPAGGPEEGLQVIIGLRAKKAGVSSARAVEITYTIGDREYEETYEQSVHLCAPLDQYEVCPPAGEEDTFGDAVLE